MILKLVGALPYLHYSGARMGVDVGWFEKRTTVNGFQPIPASAWLFEKGLKNDAKVWEHSVGLPNDDAVLTLFGHSGPIEEWDEASPNEPELDPEEFTLRRKYWPRKR